MKLIIAFLLVSFTSLAQDIEFDKKITQDSLLIAIKNNLHAPITLRFTPKPSKQNLVRGAAIIIQPLDTVVSAMSISLSAIQDTANVNPLEYFDFKGFLGDSIRTKHDDSYAYRFPFERKKRIKIIQSFGGSFTHNTPRSYYAIDFGMQIGDTIYAARDGKVVKIEDEFNAHGGPAFFNKANLIVIMHPDGTLANYIHLDYKGVFVQPGQDVERGEPIGISGMTGFTNIPHLHFMVSGANDKSVPIYFKGFEGKKLKPDKKYRH